MKQTQARMGSINIRSAVAFLALAMLATLFVPTSASAAKPGSTKPGLAPAGKKALIEADNAGGVDAYDGACSLAEAILSANGTPANNNCTVGVAGHDEIVLLAKSYDYSTPHLGLNALPAITDDVTIRSNFPGRTFVRRVDGPKFRLFDVTSGNLTIENVELIGGDAGASNGGAIRFEGGGDLTVLRAVIRNHTADEGAAIAAFDVHEFTLVDSEIRNNVGNAAVGVEASGAITVERTAFLSNIGPKTDDLGAAWLHAPYPGSPIVVRNSRFSHNVAHWHAGAALHADGPNASVVVEASEFTENDSHVATAGLSINNISGPTLVADSTISSNRSDFAFHGYSAGLDIFGGALSNGSIPTRIERTTITNNWGGSEPPVGPAAAGFSVDTVPELHLDGVIISGNVGWHPHHGQPLTADIDLDYILATVGVLTVANSIVGDDTLTTLESTGVDPTMVPAGFLNAAADTTGTAFALDAIIEPLVFVKYQQLFPTRSHAPAPGSPAIDGAGNCHPVGGLSTDQHLRPRTALCDIGAHEIQ